MCPVFMGLAWRQGLVSSPGRQCGEMGQLSWARAGPEFPSPPLLFQDGAWCLRARGRARAGRGGRARELEEGLREAWGGPACRPGFSCGERG